MKRISFVLAGLVFLLAGCGGGPEFINHPRPSLPVDYTPFEEAGCSAGSLPCQPTGELAELGCDTIRNPGDLFGGLQPAYPLAICILEPFLNYEGGEPAFPEEGTYFYSEGGLSPRFIRYVIYRDGGFELIHNEQEFSGVFAPVNSADEALSYALAVSGASARFGLQPDPALEYSVNRLEDTHVESSPNGYLVQLYDYQFFGCGPHYTYDIELLVTVQGEVQNLGSEPVFRNPDEDGLCID